LQTQIVSVTSPYDTNKFKDVVVQCPPGWVVLGGGASINSPVGQDKSIVVQETFPLSQNAWKVRVIQQDLCSCLDYPWSTTAWAVCTPAQ
jgi:hypothetical protein